MLIVDGVSGQAQSGSLREAQLVRSAHEFEAQMMKELLRPLTAGDSGEDGDSGSGSARGDFAAEALGQALSVRGGLGIATSILHSLSQTETASALAPIRELPPHSPDRGSWNAGDCR